MNPSTLTIATLDLNGKTVELLVMHNDPTWYWEVRSVGQKVDVGAAETRIAAQVAAQYAFEVVSASRKRIADAQRERWAKQKATVPSK